LTPIIESLCQQNDVDETFDHARGKGLSDQRDTVFAADCDQAGFLAGRILPRLVASGAHWIEK
jgi:hypothetical protein